MKPCPRLQFLGGVVALGLAACSARDGSPVLLPGAKQVSFRPTPDGVELYDTSAPAASLGALRLVDGSVLFCTPAGVTELTYVLDQALSEQTIGSGFRFFPRTGGLDVSRAGSSFCTVRAAADGFTVEAPAFAFRATIPSASVVRPMAVFANCAAWKDAWNWAFAALVLASAAMVAEAGLDPLADAAYVLAVANMQHVNSQRPPGCR